LESSLRRLQAVIDLGAIRRNVASLRAVGGPGVALMPAVKADAYGHGLEPVSRALAEAGVEWLGVATVEEGARARRTVPAARVCLLSPFLPPDAPEVLRLGLVPLLSTWEQARSLEDAAARAGAVAEAHLEIDTGMGRSGVPAGEAGEAAARLAGLPHIRITGAATHFACAETDPEFTARQASLFDRLLESLRAAGLPVETVHAANSAALLARVRSRDRLARPGLMVYGISPFGLRAAPDVEVRPALTLRTRVALVRSLPAGHPISYGATCRLARPSRVATLPVGYGDGYPRALSGRGCVLLQGRRAPILGRVCMDMMVVDATDVPGAAPGDEAVLIGTQGGEQIRAEELAALAETTEHAITTCLTSRVERVWIE